MTPAGDSHRRTPVRRQAMPSGPAVPVCMHPAVCPECDSRLVQPVDWSAVSGLWRVCRRCPECEWTGSDLLLTAVAEQWDEELESAAAGLEAALEALVRLNMGEELTRLRDALAGDRLLPEDF